MAKANSKNIRELAAELEQPPADSEDNRLRERVKRYLIQRFYTRFHMSLILASSGFAAMLTNWAMLREGVHAMWIRYPIAIALSYLTFLAGVWLWLKYTDATRACMAESNDSPPARTKASSKGNSFVDAGNLVNTDLVPNIGGGGSIDVPGPLGGGGAFDGGGAGGDWVDANPVQAFAGNPVPAPSGGNFFGDAAKGISDKVSGFCDLDGDAIVLIVIALMLMGSLILLGGYVIWFAPDILSEAVFGATLAGGLAHAAKRNAADGWVMGVVRKTWWPFTIVFVIAMIFALYAAAHYPEASTFSGALSAAIAG